jgi:hypothetical protein
MGRLHVRASPTEKKKKEKNNRKTSIFQAIKRTWGINVEQLRHCTGNNDQSNRKAKPVAKKLTQSQFLGNVFTDGPRNHHRGDGDKLARKPNTARKA